MFSSEVYITDVHEVPTQWILQHYLELGYKLVGQTVKVKSFFNPKDKDPSLAFYWKNNRYVFKCFSTGKNGGTIDAMMELFNMDFSSTAQKILDDYKIFLSKGGGIDEIDLNIVEHEWCATNISVRKWNTYDAKFWTAINASSNLLTGHFIKPIETYTLSKVEKESRGVLESFDIGPANHIYGYFKEDGTLYKVYRPFRKKGKFITLDPNYIQGEEQLEGHDFLVIASSMKDLIVLKSLGIKADVVAPGSENTMLTNEKIEEYKQSYKAIVTLFDPDEAGVKAMKIYLDEFDIPFCYLPYKDDRDLADMMKYEKFDYTLQRVVPVLNKAIEKYMKLNQEKDVVL
jgi:hypothetical protein